MADGYLARIDLHSHAGRCFLASQLQDRGLPSADVEWVLGGNALNLLNRVL